MIEHMFFGLAAAIDELDIPVAGDAIAEVIGLRGRLDSKISDAVGEFDAAKLWDLDDATSMTAWLRAKALMTGADASTMRVVAKKMRWLPVTARA
jgi:hypothetical protein